MWGLTDHIWNPRLAPEDSLHRGAVYLIVFFIDKSPRSYDFTTAVGIVHTGKRSSLTHIPGHSEIMNAVEWN